MICPHKVLSSRVAVSLSPEEEDLLASLQGKMGLPCAADVLRIGLRRMAIAEGVAVVTSVREHPHWARLEGCRSEIWAAIAGALNVGSECFGLYVDLADPERPKAVWMPRSELVARAAENLEVRLKLTSCPEQLLPLLSSDDENWGAFFVPCPRITTRRG